MSILTSVMISAYVVVRAQSISYILFVLEIYFIRMLLETNENRYVIYLFIISLLICNIHIAVWPLYFVLYLPYIVEYLITKIRKLYKFLSKKLLICKENNIKKLLFTMLISLGTGVLTPLDFYPYTYFIKTSIGNSQSYILEHGLGFGVSIITVSLILVSFLVALILLKSKEKIRIIDIFMICGLCLMTVLSQRHFALLIILGMISLSSILITYLKKNNFVINMLFDSKLFFYVVVIEVIFISGIKFIYTANKDYVNKEFYPIQAVNYLKDNYDVNNIRIFNEYDFGSYLILNDVPVFIDSRADLYTNEFSGLSYDIFDDFMDINSGNINKLESYNIDVVFIYRDRVLDSQLKNDYDYIKVYQDDYFVIYEYRNSFSSG